MRNIRRFLADGDKCKITLRFRGREITHQELGLALLNRIRDELADSIIMLMVYKRCFTALDQYQPVNG